MKLPGARGLPLERKALGTELAAAKCLPGRMASGVRQRLVDRDAASNVTDCQVRPRCLGNGGFPGDKVDSKYMGGQGGETESCGALFVTKSMVRLPEILHKHGRISRIVLIPK